MLISIVLVVSGLFFLKRRALRYLHFFQQEEYSTKRFIRWWWEKRGFDKRATMLIAASALVLLLLPSWGVSSVLSLGLVALGWKEEDPRVQGKVKLKMTERATRICWTGCGIAAVALLLAVILINAQLLLFLALALCIQLTPFWLILGNACLLPQERKRQRDFIAEAKTLLGDVSPYVIGITGSYGKTSTKDALGQILQIAAGPTFWPAKGVNTPMGTTREIRTRLKRGYKYAVMEMGAYGRGSIKRLCSLTPPHAAIITAIGSAHLQRFGSRENIRLAKAELAQALPQHGILVCNGDDAGARQIARENPKKQTLFYGYEQEKGDLDCWISSSKVTEKGMVFTLRWAGREYAGSTRLLGKLSLSNAIAAFTMACALGCNPEYVLAVIANLEAVDNRLQIRKEGEVTYLCDAYNSNPRGFAAALEVMRDLPGSRRILMTPGMIELGEKQEEDNERAGKMAASMCDMALVVGETNRKALMKGLGSSLKPDQLYVCATRDEAFTQLQALKRAGDIILIENDLPDLYEAKPKF